MNNKILCVDDEESILRGFQLNLRKDFELHLASNGKEGLEVFEKEKGFALVLSDMRMPEMDGATMLSKIKEIDSEVVTVLLTGHTDFESAIAAVNEGNVFRMLSKPCPPETLIKVLKDGLDQHDLIVSKKFYWIKPFVEPLMHLPNLFPQQNRFSLVEHKGFAGWQRKLGISCSFQTPGGWM